MLDAGLAFVGGATVAGAMLGRPLATGGRYGAALLVQSALLGAAPLLVAAESMGLGAAVAAAATGLQNGMSSNYPGMALRTSHRTGTLTDLGAFVGRRGHRHSEKWKGGLLAANVSGFVLGGALGGIWSSHAGIYALRAPAACCAVLGLAYVLYRHPQHVNASSTSDRHSPHNGDGHDRV